MVMLDEWQQTLVVCAKLSLSASMGCDVMLDMS